jgi:uncharacterized protein (TIGR03086 family)
LAGLTYPRRVEAGIMTAAQSDPVELLARALDQAGNVLEGVRAGQRGLATPCRSWTVAQLSDHLVQDLGNFLLVAAGERADWSAPAPAQDDPAGAFRKEAATLLAAWRAKGELAGMITLPVVGEVPARFPVDQQVAEFAVHAWDLAVATGQSVAWDLEVGEAALGWLRATLPPRMRGSEAEGRAFGPEVAVAADAPLYERLAAFAGHDPGYSG